VCISILHTPGDDPTMYEQASERWSPVQSVEKVILSVISMLAGKPLISFFFLTLVYFYGAYVWFSFSASIQKYYFANPRHRTEPRVARKRRLQQALPRQPTRVRAARA
jgi:hypothetical protein